MSDYIMVIRPLTEDDGGGYFAYFPDLPGCVSDGDTPAEAAENAEDALRCWMEAQAERGIEVPAPGASQVEAEEEIEAMTRAIARLTTELEEARQRVEDLEALNGAWVRKPKRLHVREGKFAAATRFHPRSNAVA